MQFVIQTTYDQKAMTAMARTMRKTVRKEKSKNNTFFGGAIVLLVALLVRAKLEAGDPFDGRDFLMIAAAMAIILVQFTQDHVNGWLARRKILPGTETGTSTFTEEGYTTSNTAAETRWSHKQIMAAYETPDYFVFFLSHRHGQVYDKKGFLEGTPDAFREFIEAQTGKPVAFVK